MAGVIRPSQDYNKIVPLQVLSAKEQVLKNQNNLLNYIFSFLTTADFSSVNLVSIIFNKSANQFFNEDKLFLKIYENTFNEKNAVDCNCEYNPPYSLTNHQKDCSTLFFLKAIDTYGTKPRAPVLFEAAINSRHFPQMNMYSLFEIIKENKLNPANLASHYEFKNTPQWTKIYLLFIKVVLQSSRQKEIPVQSLLLTLSLAIESANKNAMETILASPCLNEKITTIPKDTVASVLTTIDQKGYRDVLEKVLNSPEISDTLRDSINSVFQNARAFEALLQGFQNTLDVTTSSFRATLNALQDQSNSD